MYISKLEVFDFGHPYYIVASSHFHNDIEIMYLAVRTRCDSVLEPKNGRADCTGSGEIGSVCTFHCDAGFELTGADRTECVLHKS